MSNFIKHVQELKKQSNYITFFYDLETLMINEGLARKTGQPKHQKNYIYSFAVSYIYMGKLELAVFPNTDYFLNELKRALRNPKTGKIKKGFTIKLNAHNSNKYDNHFVLNDILYYYPEIERDNQFIKNAVNNNNTVKVSSVKSYQDIILEKRVKSKNNLELTFFIENIKFITEDNYLKTHTSIATLGQKLLALGIITEEQTKTDFDYNVFNKDEDMTEEEARQYCLECFHKLDQNQITYIENDVIILGETYINFDLMFPEFDYDKYSLTANISAKFCDNELTTFQMLNRVKSTKVHVKYTDYRLGNINFYEYLKRFYNGGLNFYNDKIVNTILNRNIKAIDISSSYPFSMDSVKIPTYLVSARTFDKYQSIDVEISDDTYTLYQVDKTYFNMGVLSKIKSSLVKKIIVKYYNNKFKDIYINSYTLRLINLFLDEPLQTIEVKSFSIFETREFGNKEFLRENYYNKSIGKCEHKITFNTPYDYVIDYETENDHKLTDEEVYVSKLYNNGGYGFPALKPFFNLFRLDTTSDTHYNQINGFKNTERNILFSLFVTSVSLYNLLKPLSYMTPEEIDEYVYYGDTDSLYYDECVHHRLPKHIFDPYKLGSWTEDADIRKMMIVNHKKYAYERVDGKIKILSGGIRKDKVFNLKKVNYDFDEFVRTQFQDGVQLDVDKTVMNYQGVLTFYKAKTDIQKGKPYPLLFSSVLTKQISDMLDRAKEDLTINGVEDLIYLESPLGSFGIMDVFEPTYEYENKRPIENLIGYIHYVKNMIE